jgi:hypothetical protein
VLDGVCVVQVGPLDQSLKVVYWRPRLALGAVRGDHDALRVGVVRFLVIVVVGHGRHPLRASLAPLVALGAPLGISNPRCCYPGLLPCCLG